MKQILLSEIREITLLSAPIPGMSLPNPVPGLRPDSSIPGSPSIVPVVCSGCAVVFVFERWGRIDVFLIGIL